MRPLPLAALALLLAGAAPPPPVAPAGKGMVSAADARAAEAGREILRAGGSAADAEIAMMFALTVVEPQSSGIGGGGYFVHRDAAGRVETIDGRETAPAAARPDRFIGADGRPVPFSKAFPGGRSVGVPGNVRLAEMAHRRWGRLPWSRLLQPAIRLAEQGYAMAPLTARYAGMVAPLWKDFPAIAALYSANGAVKPAGTPIRNPALAAILRRIAGEGPDAFYAGDNAAAIATAVSGAPVNPVPLTRGDLAGYRAKPQPPVCGRYRGYTVCGMAPSSSGGITILQMLGMLERFDLKAMGPDSPVAWHLIGEAMQLAYADRDQYLGDAAFVKIPVAGLLDPGYLAKRSASIEPTRSIGRYGPGAPAGAPVRTPGTGVDEHGTTDFVAADARGDVVTMTSTVESFFGSQLVANGYVLNNEMTDFSFAPEKDGAPVANRVQAGKRPLSSMSPTIVTGPDGRLVLAVGSAGGKRIIMHVMKTLVGVLDWGLSAQEAIALPNIYFDDNGLLVEKSPRMDRLAPIMAGYGQPVREIDLGSKLNAIERLSDGRYRGAADPRSEGVAIAQ